LVKLSAHPGHFRPASSETRKQTHPTLTQQPPLIPFSINNVFFPYQPAALLAYPSPISTDPNLKRAALPQGLGEDKSEEKRNRLTVPEPPLPPPITIYSNSSGSVEIGAIGFKPLCLTVLDVNLMFACENSATTRRGWK
jgi:hypothetical protein